MKKLCLLLCWLTLFLYSCENKPDVIEPALPINSQLSENELSELELSENQYAVKLYGNLPPFLHIIRDYGSIDAYEESLRTEQKSMEDNVEVVVCNINEGSLVYPQNENEKYTFMCDHGRLLPYFLYDTDKVLGNVITYEVSGMRRSYTVDRILFLKCEDANKDYFEYVIYYETNRGTYVLFLQNLHERLNWVVPLEIVKEKCIDWPSELYPGNQTNSYIAVFGDEYRMTIVLPEDYV